MCIVIETGKQTVLTELYRALAIHDPKGDGVDHIPSARTTWKQTCRRIWREDRGISRDGVGVIPLMSAWACRCAFLLAYKRPDTRACDGK